MKTSLIISIIAIVLISIFLVGCQEQAGEAFRPLAPKPTVVDYDEPVKDVTVRETESETFKKAKEDLTAKPTTTLSTRESVLPKLDVSVERTTVFDRLPEGCHLQLREGYLTLPSADKGECKDLFIASEFNKGALGKNNIYKLLKYLEHSMDLTARAMVLDPDHELVVFYKEDNGNTNRFEDVSMNFVSDKCETINFFGQEIYCFNEVTSGNGKNNNLRWIIPQLTLLKFTSGTSLNNPLVNKIVDDVFGFVKYSDPDHTTVLHDALGLVFDNLDMETTSGCKYEHSPSASGGPQRVGKIYICPPMLRPESIELPNIMHNVAILYHEANHKIDYLSHNLPDPNRGHQTTCFPGDSAKLEIGIDRDMVSVFGAHIVYLLDMSQNPILTCDERKAAYDDANEIMSVNLCQAPNMPHHEVPSPDC